MNKEKTQNKSHYKKGRHAERAGGAPRTSASSTQTVLAWQQQRQALKTLKANTQTPDKNFPGRGQAVKAAVQGDFMTKTTRGFTLIELLVVVLIIGILAAVALPQYQRAVDKSRVATILPLMRRWADALSLYKLENGSYANSTGENPSADEIGSSWPRDWEQGSAGTEGENSLWYCMANEERTGYVYCDPKWKKEDIMIMITQLDDTDFPAGKRFCTGVDESFCKLLGGKPIAGYDDYYEF